MSGVKDSIVNLRESEKNRILASVHRGENFFNELGSRINEANMQLRSEFKNNFSDIKKRHEDFEKGLSGLQSALDDSEKRQNRRIHSLNQRMEDRFEETDNRIYNLNDRMGREFSKVGQNLEKGLSGLQSALDDSEKRQNHRIHSLNQRMEVRFEETDDKIHNLNDRMGREFTRVDQNIQDINKDVVNLNRHMETEFERVDDEISNLDQRVQGQLRSQRHEYVELIGKQGEIFEKKIIDQNHIFTQAITEQRQELQGQIKQIATHIRSKEQSDEKAASTWVADVQLVLDNINKNTRHNKFKPGALDDIYHGFSLAENNLKSGQNQAAIAAAQASYLKAQELKMELAQREQEWNMYLMQARTSVTEVLAMCDTQNAAKFTVDTEEGSEDVAAEIDFWTAGQLTVFRKKVEAENQHLTTDDDSLTLDSLKASIQQSHEWMQESEEITEAARESLIKSQVRQNIAQSVADSFDGTGWQLVDSTYAGEDFRDSLHAKFIDPSGDEIVTIVHPEKSSSGEILNRLEVNFFDKSNDERFRHARLQNIFQHMSNGGIEAEQPKTRTGYETGPGDESVRDFEHVRQQQSLGNSQ